MSGEITVSAVEVDRSIKREVTSEWSLWIDDDDNERGLSNVCERSLTASLDAISTLFGDELCSGIAKTLTSSLTSSKSHLLLTFEFRSVDTDEPSSLLISCLCPQEIKGLERRCPFWVAPRPFLSPLLVWPLLFILAWRTRIFILVRGCLADSTLLPTSSHIWFVRTHGAVVQQRSLSKRTLWRRRSIRSLGRSRSLGDVRLETWDQAPHFM